MLETSKDVLNLSLAVSVFGLAFLVGWILVYFIVIVRRLVKLLTGIEERMRKIDDFLILVKEKLEHSTSHLALLATAVKELIGYFVDRRSSAPRGKKPVTL